MCIGATGSSPISLLTDAAAIASGNPEALLAAAATTAGNYIQTENNNANLQREYNARDAVMQQGVAQQDQDAAQAQGVLNKAVNTFQQPAQATALANAKSDRTNAILANENLPSSFVDPTSNANAPKVVQSALAQKMADAVAYDKQQATALGGMGGAQDVLQQGNINIGSSGAQLGNINAIAKGQYNANQVEQQSAVNNARRGPSAVGQGISDIGTLLGLDSFSGGNVANGVGNYLGITQQPSQATTDFVNNLSAANGAGTAPKAGWLSQSGLTDAYGNPLPGV